MTWMTLSAGEVLRASRMRTSATYIVQSQGAVAQWVDLHPIFEVCAREQGFDEGGRQMRPWWTRGAGGGSQSHAVRGLAGGADQAFIMRPSWSDIELQVKVVR